MDFGTRLRILIEEKGITQKELALQFNIAPSTVSSYVQNTREPDFETLKLFAKYFDVSTDYLLDYYSDNIETEKENELIRIFRSLSTSQQDLYVEQGKAFLRINAKKYTN